MTLLRNPIERKNLAIGSCCIDLGREGFSFLYTTKVLKNFAFHKKRKKSTLNIFSSWKLDGGIQFQLIFLLHDLETFDFSLGGVFTIVSFTRNMYYMNMKEKKNWKNKF